MQERLTMRFLYLWCFSTLVACTLYAEAIAVDNPIAPGSKTGRHRHLQHSARDLSSLRSDSKLRHHQYKPNVDTANYKADKNASFAKADKFPKLKELGKRLETLRLPITTTTKSPFFFVGRSKTRPKWKYIQDYDEDEYDVEEDPDDGNDAYVDEVGRTTSTATEAVRKSKSHSFIEDDDMVEEDVNDDYYDDEIFAEDGFRPHDVQADEHEQSPMTQYKWANYGTRQAVEEAQRHSADAGNSERKSVRAANEHFLHMKSAAKCRLPRPRVVNVEEVHQLPGKAFRPHCTVLYRCGDDTGCCQGTTKKCRAKSQEIIYLHFYVYSTTFGQSQSVERLAFHNHTECACLDEMEESKVSNRLIRSRGHYSRNSLPQPERPSCKCPEEFVSSMNHRFGRCVCDCPASSDLSSGCTSMKRGEEHLSLRDRKCILEDKCTPPTCRYGTYVKYKGRCPRRHEVSSSGTSGYTNGVGTRSDSDNNDDSIED